MVSLKNNPIKKVIGLAGFVTISIFAVFPATASQGLSIVLQESGPGSFACLNNSNPVCNNPLRAGIISGTRFADSWLCLNSPYSECNPSKFRSSQSNH